VAETWVVNASPVIALARAGFEHLLTGPSRSVLLPQAVVEEIVAGPPNDPARVLLERGWASIATPKSIPTSVVEWGLGRGETQVLAIALETPGSTAVLDDAAARTAARAVGIPVIGTLGIVVRAKLQQEVASAAAVIVELRGAGFYLDDSVVHDVLHQVGEQWPPSM
jgi:predicted nucleic acid-binding protein